MGGKAVEWGPASSLPWGSVGGQTPRLPSQLSVRLCTPHPISPPPCASSASRTPSPPAHYFCPSPALSCLTSLSPGWPSPAPGSGLHTTRSLAPGWHWPCLPVCPSSLLTCEVRDQNGLSQNRPGYSPGQASSWPDSGSTSRETLGQGSTQPYAPHTAHTTCHKHHTPTQHTHRTQYTAHTHTPHTHTPHTHIPHKPYPHTSTPHTHITHPHTARRTHSTHCTQHTPTHTTHHTNHTHTHTHYIPTLHTHTMHPHTAHNTHITQQHTPTHSTHPHHTPTHSISHLHHVQYSHSTQYVHTLLVHMLHPTPLQYTWVFIMVFSIWEPVVEYQLRMSEHISHTS